MVTYWTVNSGHLSEIEKIALFRWLGIVFMSFAKMNLIALTTSFLVKPWRKKVEYILHVVKPERASFSVVCPLFFLQRSNESTRFICASNVSPCYFICASLSLSLNISRSHAIDIAFACFPVLETRLPQYFMFPCHSIAFACFPVLETKLLIFFHGPCMHFMSAVELCFAIGA